MQLQRIYSESIRHLPYDMQEILIREAPHTRIIGVVPSGLEFLKGGLIDLGFENLNLSQDEFIRLSRAFVNTGIIIPKRYDGILYKLRYVYPTTVIEPAIGNEPVLPDNWQGGILVLGDDDQIKWVGKLVRPDQIIDLNLDQYIDSDHGYSRKQMIHVNRPVGKS